MSLAARAGVPACVAGSASAAPLPSRRLPSRSPIPDLLFASWVTAEPFAYPLLLSASSSPAPSALARSRARRHAVLLLALRRPDGVRARAVRRCSRSASSPPCSSSVSARGACVRVTLREQSLPSRRLRHRRAWPPPRSASSRFLGLYESALDQRAADRCRAARARRARMPWSSRTRPAGSSLPGAILAFALALGATAQVAASSRSARSPCPSSVALLLEAGLVGAVEHRSGALRLLPPAACGRSPSVSTPREAGLPRSVSALIAAVPPHRRLLARFRSPASTAAEGKAHSPFLLAAFRFEESLGSPGSRFARRSPRPPAILGIAVIVLSARARRLATSDRPVPAVADCLGGCLRRRRRLRQPQLHLGHERPSFPAEPSWVDRPGFDDVTLVRAPHGLRTEALEQLFWNPSVYRVVAPPRRRGGRPRPLPRLSRRCTTARLLSDGRPLAGSRARRRLCRNDPPRRGRPDRLVAVLHALASARRRRGSRSTSPAATATAGSPVPAASTSGPSAPVASFDGACSFPLSAPPGAGRADASPPRSPPDAAHRALRAGDGRRPISFPVCSRGPWFMSYSSTDDAASSAGVS